MNFRCRVYDLYCFKHISNSDIDMPDSNKVIKIYEYDLKLIKVDPSCSVFIRHKFDQTLWC